MSAVRFSELLRRSDSHIGVIDHGTATIANCYMCSRLMAPDFSGQFVACVQKTIIHRENHISHFHPGLICGSPRN